jgi:hypothetical protein
MALAEVAIRAAKRAAKHWRPTDGAGLFLLLAPSGGRLWRFKYRFQGLENLIGLGKYPEVFLRMPGSATAMRGGGSLKV